jgi:uncharacterized membrane protein (UPF0136 family)
MTLLDLARSYLFLFGALTIAGGVLGFVKAKSRASLIAGTLSGVSLLAAGYLVGTRGMLGLALGLLVSFSLAGRFIGAYKKSGKFMPAGLMSVLGMAGVVITIVALILRSS